MFEEKYGSFIIKNVNYIMQIFFRDNKSLILIDLPC